MNMKSATLAVLADSAVPITSEEIILAVRTVAGIEWKGSSIRKALGVLVTQGKVKNLDRDPVTGNYRRIPCRYELAS